MEKRRDKPIKEIREHYKDDLMQLRKKVATHLNKMTKKEVVNYAAQLESDYQTILHLNTQIAQRMDSVLRVLPYYEDANKLFFEVKDNARYKEKLEDFAAICRDYQKIRKDITFQGFHDAVKVEK